MAQESLPDFSTLFTHVQSHELFHKSLDDTQPNQAAFTAKSRDRCRGSSSRGRGSSTNRSCGRNHRFQSRCQFCRSTDHDAFDCKYRFDQNYDRSCQPSNTVNLAEALSAGCSLDSGSSSDWFLDTGASAHMTPDANQLDNILNYSGSDHVTVGNGAHLPISHIGSLSISQDLKLRNVLVVPGLTKNLLSIGQLTRDFPVTVTFTESQFCIQNRDIGQLLVTCMLDRGLYVLHSGTAALSAITKNKKLQASFDLWHYRLGHVAHSIISILQKLGYVSVTSILPSPSVCNPCQMAKSK